MNTNNQRLDTKTPFETLRPLLDRHAGGIETDMEFARRIAANQTDAVNYFLGDYSKPILDYIAVDIFHQSGFDHGSPGNCIQGEFYEFIAAPFAKGSDKLPEWRKVAQYEARNGKRFFSWIGYITRNHFIEIKKKFVKKNECSLLEFADYAALITCNNYNEAIVQCPPDVCSRLQAALNSLSQQDRCVLQCLVMGKMHWTQAFEILRVYLNPLGPDKAWEKWNFDEKQQAIDRCWTAKNRQDAMAGLKRRAIEHLAKRYKTLKNQGR